MTHPVALYVSVDRKIEFFVEEDSAQSSQMMAQVNGDPKRVPVILPIAYSSARSLSQQVQCLVQNYHWRPICSSNAQGVSEVSFEYVNPESITWEKCAERSLPRDAIMWVDLSMDAISYSFVNTVKTWNWKKDQEIAIAFKITSITTICRLSNNKLIVGNEKGQLCVEGEDPFQLNHGEIFDIIPLAGPCCCVTFSCDKSLVVDTQKQEELLGFPTGAVYSIKNEKLAVFHDSQLHVFQFNPDENCWEEQEGSIWGDIRLSEVREFDDNIFLLLGQDKKRFAFWNADDHSLEEYEDPSLFQRALDGRVLRIDRETLAFWDTGRSCSISFYCDKQVNKTPERGNYGILRAIALSNGSVMYATDSRGAGLHIVSSPDKIIFSKKVEDLIGKDIRVNHFTECFDGSIVVQCDDTCFVLRPKTKSLSESKEYQKEKVFVQGAKTDGGWV